MGGQLRVLISLLPGLLAAYVTTSEAGVITDPLLPLLDARGSMDVRVEAVVDISPGDSDKKDWPEFEQTQVAEREPEPETGSFHFAQAIATIEADDFTASVKAETTSAIASPDPRNPHRADAFAQANIDYLMRISLLLEPLVPVPRVPVIVSATLSNTGFGLVESFAALLINGPEVDVLFETGIIPGLDRLAIINQPLQPLFGREYGVFLFAECFTSVRVDLTARSECEAIADPIFSFDQATFDRLMGENSFPLEDFFAFEFSPNLSSSEPGPGTVPEPSSIALLGLGLISLLFMRRRKFQNRPKATA